MNVVLGASGQIGSMIINELIKKGKPVTAIVRDKQKVNKLKRDGINVETADLFDVHTLKTAFTNADTAFLLTPENPKSENVHADADLILKNYKEAIQFSGIKKIVGLSSIGAQHKTGTGDLEVSYRLEHSFKDLPVKQIFIRPAYYYSNWLAYFEAAKEQGVLPTFFPVDLKIPMAAPTDVAEFIAKAMTDEGEKDNLYELVGPFYSATDVANIFGQILNRRVDAQEIPMEQWKPTLQQVGFSDNAADNLIKMTEAVIHGKTKPEKKKNDWIPLPTTLEDYLSRTLETSISTR